MSYQTLNDQLNALSEQELVKHVLKLDNKAAKQSLSKLNSEDRYLFFQGVTRIPVAYLTSLTHCGKKTKMRLEMLRDHPHLNTYARVAGILFEDLLDREGLYTIDRSPISSAPAVILVTTRGAQVPAPRPTIGNQMRRRFGMIPPLGMYYIASYLTILGVETHVYNLALGKPEYQEMRDRMESLGERFWFLSFTSNFLGREEYTSTHHLADVLGQLKDDKGFCPRFIGGGRGIYFAYEDYLNNTPMEVVVGRYGDPCFADMVFSSDYQGPRDKRSNLALFGHIPNLHIAVEDKGQWRIENTNVQKLLPEERRVLAYSLDHRTIELREKYWMAGVATSVCVPDDLNIPAELVLSQTQHATNGYQRIAEILSKKKEEGIHMNWIPINDDTLPLHPSNYLYKPKTLEVMTTFGNCPRGCKFCQFTQYDATLYFMAGNEVVDQYNQILKVFPDLQMFLIYDDDFLLRRNHIINLIEHLEINEPTQGKMFFVETVPMEVEPEIMHALRHVGFRAILLGLESPVERVVRHVGKLLPRHSFEHYRQAPHIAYDAGFFTRVTNILFYPVITEPELVEAVRGLAEYINYGISVTVFPFVKALPGIEFVNNPQHEFLTSNYYTPTGKKIDVWEYILPDDLFVRELAFNSFPGVAQQLEKVLQQNDIQGDYPMPISVIAYFQNLIQTWLNLPGRTVSTETLHELQDYVDLTLNKLVRRHQVQLAVKQAALKSDDYTITPFKQIESLFEDSFTRPLAIVGLRLMIDFGDEQELVGATHLVDMLTKKGISDINLSDSLRYALKRSLAPNIRNHITQVISHLEIPKPPKLVRRSVEDPILLQSVTL